MEKLEEWFQQREDKIESLKKELKRIREDIDRILDLKPSFLVHMCRANADDIERVKEEGIPVVICPRSNDFFGIKPNLELLWRIGIEISIGTDNAMIADTNIYEELKWLKMHFRTVPIEDLLRMITYNPARIFGISCITFEEGIPADFVVLDTKSLKPISISVSRADEI
jgi:cytosine/adenosine deaminase-related metal-dependent hydrolase